LKKADKTPEEAKMKMKHAPFAPTLVGENVILQKVWSEFQNSFIF
jgi:hypothetical protein